MDFLKSLNINKLNPGVSTGSNWLKASGEKINSYSPVDGKLIGTVTAADWTAYNLVIKKAEQAFTEWRRWPG